MARASVRRRRRAQGEIGSQREKESRLSLRPQELSRAPQELCAPMTQLPYNQFYHLPTLPHCGPSFQHMNPQGTHSSCSQTTTPRDRVLGPPGTASSITMAYIGSCILKMTQVVVAMSTMVRKMILPLWEKVWQPFKTWRAGITRAECSHPHVQSWCFSGKMGGETQDP